MKETHLKFAAADAQVINERIAQARDDPQLEFELNFGKCDVSNEAFKRVLNAMATHFEVQRQEMTLDMTPEGQRTPRISINGREAISHFCRTNNLAEIPSLVAINKTDIGTGGGTHTVEDYGINVNLRKEEAVSDVDVVAQQMQHIQKNFRLKQRVSFSSPDAPFKVDCTVVNMPHKPANALTQSGIFGTAPRYEIEVELIDKNREQLFEKLVEITSMIYQNIENSPYSLTMSRKTAVIEGYVDLIHSLGFVESSAPAAQVKAKPTMFFIGPKPMTLSWENILPEREGRVSVLNNYTVTDKADGERVLMYVDKDGDAFIIDSRFNVRFTGISIPEFKDSLLDGEYIDTWKVSENAAMVRIMMAAFLAFDVYCVKTELVANKHLVPDRINVLDQVMQAASASKDAFVQFKKKTFLYGDNMFESIAKVLDTDRPYKTDGLIFTPANVAVGANYPHEPPNMRGRWLRALKWKPPEQNTVDFLVKLGAEVTLSANVYKYVTLYVGSNETTSEKLNILGILGQHAPKLAPSSKYVEKEFATALLPMKDGRLHCESGEVVTNNTIIEFAYKRDTSEWVPLRVRHDKTQLFNSTKLLSNTANDYNVAKNVLETVTNPVTVNMLIGKEMATYDMDDDRYYMRDTKRSNLETKPMLDFHNYWVKNNMLYGNLKSCTSLFELACGKASDLMKWMKNGFKLVVGVDISEDNLLNPVDGAYARLAGRADSAKGNEKYVFCQWDISKPFADGNQTIIKDTTLKSVTETVFGLTPKTKIKKDMAKFYNIGNGVFDVVSCQFAVHYMFESHEMLRQFADNVATRVKTGGYFIGTCMDGAVVDQQLNKSPTRSIRATKNGKLIWSVVAKYDNFDDTFGKKVDIYIESINQVVPEYLVDFGMLTKVMEERGLKLMDKLPELGLDASHGSFKDAFADMEKSGRADHIVQSILENITPEEKQFSFMNKWFIFKAV